MNYFSYQSAAGGYAKYRLDYHALVVERVRVRLGLTRPVAQAPDVACGTGLSAVPLAAHGWSATNLDMIRDDRL